MTGQAGTAALSDFVWASPVTVGARDGVGSPQLPTHYLSFAKPGLPGMATIHANSAREALVKLCTLPLLAGENISARFVVPTVASLVDLVVHLGLDNSGTRRVNEIVAVPGRTENDIVEIEPVFVRQGRRPRARRWCARTSRHLRAGRR